MPHTDEEKDALVAMAGTVDAVRSAGLQFLDQAVRARQAGLEREHRRLSRKLGADHPRVKATAMRIEADAALRRELVVDVARAKTVSPKRGADEWALHGLLLWKDLRPAPDLTVSLVDAKGEWLKSVGFACTDARGYFQLVAPVARTPGAQDAPGRTDAGATIQAWIRVTDANRKQLHREANASSVVAGTTEYREIVLGEEAGPVCAPPEEVPGPDIGGQPAKPEGSESGRGRRASRRREPS